MSRSDDVITYLEEYAKESSSSDEIKALEKHIVLLRKTKKDLDTVIDNQFKDFDKNDFDYFLSKIKIFRDVEEREIDEIKLYVFLLASNYNSELEIYAIARKKIDSYVKEIEKQISYYHKQILSLKEAQNLEAAELIEKVIKKNSDGTYRVSGNITPEDYEKLISIIDKLNIPLLDKIEFTRKLNDAIADFKYRKETIISKIEEQDKNKIIEDLIGKKKTSEIISKGKKRMADFNYKRIEQVIAALKSEYANEIENGFDVTVIDKNTPINKDRLKLYLKDQSKNYDFKIVLYDLLNFINPSEIESMYLDNKITAEELDIIRNVIYVNIYKKYQLYLNNKALEKLQLQGKLNKEAIIDMSSITETMETAIAQEVEKQKEQEEIKKKEEKIFVNEKVVDLSEEEKNKILDAIKKGNNYILEFKKKYDLQDGILSAINNPDISVHYKIEEKNECTELIAVTIPKFIKDFEDYKIFFEVVKYDKEYDDQSSIELIEDLKQTLISDASSLIDKIETFIIEPKELGEDDQINLDGDISNVIILPQTLDKVSSEIYSDVKEMVSTGQVKPINVHDSLVKLEHIDTIHPKSPTLESISCIDWIEKEYNPYRFRDGSSRFVYININICDENLANLQSVYGINNNNLRILYIPMIFYKAGDTSAYQEVQHRIKKTAGSLEEVGSIDWIKGIFNTPFTNETKQLAYDLINNSLDIMKKIKEGELSNVPNK